jgi:mono/diheme cytochrome c family protein
MSPTGRGVRACSAFVVLLLGALACGRTPSPADTARTGAPAAPPGGTPTPAPVLPYEARLGKVTYEHYCQTCHGESGAGDGFNAFNLDPHPRDLSDPAFQKSRADADLLDTVRRGGAGVGLSSLMPPFGRTLSERRLNEVVLYLRMLRRPPA